MKDFIPKKKPKDDLDMAVRHFTRKTLAMKKRKMDKKMKKMKMMEM